MKTALKPIAAFTIISLLTLCYSEADAQEKDTAKNRKWMEHQVGINASNFVLTFISFNQGFLGNNNPYLVNYRGIYLFENSAWKGVGLRAGLGQSGFTSNQENPITTAKTENESSNNAWRVGVEVQRNLGKRWMAYGGVDYIGSKNKNRNYSSQIINGNEISNENTTETISRGYGLVVGTQFHLNSYISMGTSLMYTNTNLRNTRVVVNSNPSSIPTVTNTEGTMSQLLPPVFVDFLVRF